MKRGELVPFDECTHRYTRVNLQRSYAGAVECLACGGFRLMLGGGKLGAWERALDLAESEGRHG